MGLVLFSVGAGLLGIGLKCGWDGLFDEEGKGYFADKRAQAVAYGSALIAGGIALMGLALKSG